MSIENTPDRSQLGRASEYRSEYAPKLLFPIPRQQKRDELGLVSGSLPFVGEDLWNAYELSWLNARGKPVVAIGEFRVPAASACLIESKSLKLYLNSLNQTHFSRLEEVQTCIARDLSAAAGLAVSVRLTNLSDRPPRQIAYPQGECLDGLDIEVSQYRPLPEMLAIETGREVEDELLYSHLLKSNCLVTGQPDWGMVCVRYSGAAISREALLRYVISFREHNEFHEQCVERIFCDILSQCAPRRLEVWARYTRRGGLDINPYRASEPGRDPGNVFEVRQ